MFHATPYQIWSCNDYIQHSEVTDCCRLPQPLATFPGGNTHWLWMQSRSNLLSWKKVCLALDRWISTNKLALTLAIADYMDRNWALWEVNLAFDEVDSLFFSIFESWFMMIGQGPTYWSNASHTFGERTWSFWASWQPIARNYDWQCFLKLLDDSRATMRYWCLRTRVACIEEPHTMPGAHHTAGFSCIYEQSGCKGCTKCWKAHERNQQFGENESIDIRKSQRLRKEGNARINKASAMRPRLAKIIEKVRISWHFESPEPNYHIAENVCSINYADT